MQENFLIWNLNLLNLGLLHSHGHHLEISIFFNKEK